jgi:hypothetical protein
LALCDIGGLGRGARIPLHKGGATPASTRGLSHPRFLMPRRFRQFIGAMVMISFVIVYSLVAMALAQSRIVQEAPGALQAVYYALLGMIWVLPMLPLIRWMQRPDRIH